MRRKQWTFDITSASYARIERIRALRKCTANEAISYAIVVGWLAAEKVHAERQEKNKMNIENLKSSVVNLLVSRHDLLFDDAVTSVEESFDGSPDLWNENAEPEDLANFLASDDQDN